MAEKLVASLDLADAEVMMEVEVLEITRSNLQQLGIEYPTTATLSTPTNLTLANIGHLGKSDISVTPLSVTLDAMKQVGRADTLASPRIRARNREKAKILIGSREPVITNSVTPTAAGAARGHGQRAVPGRRIDSRGGTDGASGQRGIDQDESRGQLDSQTDHHVVRHHRLRDRHPQCANAAEPEGRRDADPGRIDPGQRHAQFRAYSRDSATFPSSASCSAPITSTRRSRRSFCPSRRASFVPPARPSNETTEFWYGTESNLRSAPLGLQSSASRPGAAITSSSGATGDDAPARGTALHASARSVPASLEARRASRSRAPAHGRRASAAPSAAAATGALRARHARRPLHAAAATVAPWPQRRLQPKAFETRRRPNPIPTAPINVDGTDRSQDRRQLRRGRTPLDQATAGTRQLATAF